MTRLMHAASMPIWQLVFLGVLSTSTSTHGKASPADLWSQMVMCNSDPFCLRPPLLTFLLTSTHQHLLCAPALLTLHEFVLLFAEVGSLVPVAPSTRHSFASCSCPPVHLFAKVGSVAPFAHSTRCPN